MNKDNKPKDPEKEKVKKIFWEQLSSEMNAQNLSKSQVEQKTGVGARQLYRYEKLETVPTLDVALKLAEGLNCSLDTLCV